MSNNAIFARLSNLWTGFIALWVSDVEKAHPDIAYQNAINSMVEKYAKLKSTTGAIIARRQDITGRLEAKERELAGVAADLETALATNQDDLAVVLIQKKNLLDAAITELRAEAAQAVADALGPLLGPGYSFTVEGKGATCASYSFISSRSSSVFSSAVSSPAT